MRCVFGFSLNQFLKGQWFTLNILLLRNPANWAQWSQNISSDGGGDDQFTSLSWVSRRKHRESNCRDTGGYRRREETFGFTSRVHALGNSVLLRNSKGGTTDLLFEGMWLINPTPMVKEKKKCFISSVLETAAVLWELNTLLFLTYSSNPVSHRSSEQMLTQRLGAQRVFFF